jgi:hypothetical protein
MSTTKSGSGWVKISTPEDLQKALTRMLNKILMSQDPVAHAGRFASLANAWVNAHRVELEETEWAEIKKRVAAVEEQLAKK